jgi:hypothetical protein
MLGVCVGFVLLKRRFIWCVWLHVRAVVELRRWRAHFGKCVSLELELACVLCLSV